MAWAPCARRPPGTSTACSPGSRPCGFTLAPDQIVDCAVGEGYRAERDDALDLPDAETPGHEVDYGAPEDNDYERVQRARCDVRAMRPEDLPQIVRIDREITGRDRKAYIAGKLDEAMDDSAIRVSLTARIDDAIVGYLMARADLGDFGRTEPVAVLDTIGVDPAYEHRGIGHALVSQLFVNLGALQIDRVETVVAPSDLALLGFLYDCGFKPSQRLAFMRRTVMAALPDEDTVLDALRRGRRSRGRDEHRRARADLPSRSRSTGASRST